MGDPGEVDSRSDSQVPESVKGIRLGEIEGNLDELSRALASDGVRLACLFGSVLEGSPARDIDLAVLLREYRFDKYLEMLEVACRALGTRTETLSRDAAAHTGGA